MNDYSIVKGKFKWELDVPVLCIFFARPECFSQCFESVRKARPSKLLLWQDGPREGRNDDLIGVQECRKVAENIDWDCEVFRFYNEKNYGCDPSTFYSHKWAFSVVNKCIILEDDLVPDQSFFKYCDELLKKYEFDTRINRICGICNLKNFDRHNDYVFSTVGSGPGFATWKRVADLWDENYSFLDNKYYMRKYFLKHNSKLDSSYYKTCLSHKNEGVPHWETIQTYARHLNSQYNIIPTRNLIKNVGLGEKSAHSNISLAMVPKSHREAFFQDSEELKFPLKHPEYVLEDVEYKRELFKLTGKGRPIISKIRKIESIILRIRHGGLKPILKKFFK